MESENGCVLVTEITINKITPRDSNVPWREVYFRPHDSNGLRLGPRTFLQAVDDDDGEGFQALYVDNSPEVGRLNEGDIIRFTGMNESFLGGRIEIRWDESYFERIGDVVIPEELLSLYVGDVAPRDTNGTVLYEIKLNFDQIPLVNTTLLWSECTIRIESSTWPKYENTLAIAPGNTNSSITPRAWHIDYGINTTTVEKTDEVILHGLNRTFERGIATIVYDHVLVLGSLTLPQDFIEWW